MLSKSRISNYEQGLQRLGIEEAQALARALGTVSAVYLLCLDDEAFLVVEELKLLRCFRGTDERGAADDVGGGGGAGPNALTRLGQSRGLGAG